MKKKTATPAKVAAKPKPKATDEKTVALGAAPVVLVPPAEDAAVSTDQNSQAIADQPETPQPAPRKKKTLLGLFNGTNDQVAATGPATEIQQPQIQPTPAAPAQSASAAPSTATGANGYYVQLASFKSQAEANTEYSRLKAKHSNILNGLSPVINPATVGGSTRYRLALGPLGSKREADDVCNSLTAVGERDCLVRKQ